MQDLKLKLQSLQDEYSALQCEREQLHKTQKQVNEEEALWKTAQHNAISISDKKQNQSQNRLNDILSMKADLKGVSIIHINEILTLFTTSKKICND